MPGGVKLRQLHNSVKVSIVIPALNEEARIAACVRAAFRDLARSRLSGEVIVVDNGSADHTAELALAEGARVVAEPRRGITRARQAGLAAARGEYLANIDADTLVPLGWLGAAIDLLERRPEAVVVTGPLDFYDAPRATRAAADAFFGLTWLCHRLTGTVIQGGNCLMRKSALLAAGGYDTGIEFYGEDTATAVRLARQGRILWRWDLRVRSSGRRLKGDGLWRTGARYALNWCAVAAGRRPVSLTHRDIREDADRWAS